MALACRCGDAFHDRCCDLCAAASASNALGPKGGELTPPGWPRFWIRQRVQLLGGQIGGGLQDRRTSGFARGATYPWTQQAPLGFRKSRRELGPAPAELQHGLAEANGLFAGGSRTGEGQVCPVQHCRKLAPAQFHLPRPAAQQRSARVKLPAQGGGHGFNGF
jgi:hypothetical protein